jgi:hypothetical protein
MIQQSLVSGYSRTCPHSYPTVSRKITFRIHDTIKITRKRKIRAPTIPVHHGKSNFLQLTSWELFGRNYSRS